jgi:hypothetical protein
MFIQGWTEGTGECHPEHSKAIQSITRAAASGKLRPGMTQWLRENFADSEDTDPRRSHLGVFSIDVNSIPLSIVETFSINQRLCGMI